MWTESYRKYLEYEKHYSPQTVIVYMEAVLQFDAFLKESDPNARLETARKGHVRGWMMQLMEGENKATTVNKKLSSLKNFYRYLKYKKVIAQNPTALVSGPKKAKPLPVYVREADMEKLMNGEECGSLSSFEEVRDNLILEVFYTTGMRLSELIGLQDENVDLYSNQIKVTGKRDKQRFIPFASLLKSHLEAYLEKRNGELGELPVQSFFVEADGRRMAHSKVYLIVKKKLSGVVALKKTKSPCTETYICHDHAEQRCRSECSESLVGA